MASPLRSFRIFFSIVVCLSFSFSMTGCTLFRARPLIVPEAVAGRSEVVRLAAADVTPADFDRAFPEIEGIRMSSRVLAKYRRFLGKSYFDMTIIAGGPRLIRMIARHPGDGTPLFEVLVDRAEMSVHVPPTARYFKGTIGEGETPFGESFGVEPWDVLPILGIGRRLADANFEVRPGKRASTLHLSAEDRARDGFAWVKLDTLTGLPREAAWIREDVELQVEYLAWDLFQSGGEGGGSQILPTEFIIKRKKPYAKIHVRANPKVEAQFLINPRLSEKTFSLYMRSYTTLEPLENLGRALNGN